MCRDFKAKQQDKVECRNENVKQWLTRTVFLGDNVVYHSVRASAHVAGLFFFLLIFS